MGNHATDSPVKDLGRSTVVNGAGSSGVDNVSFMKEVMVTEFVSEEATRDIDLFASNNNNFLARQDLLGDYRSQST